MLDLQALLSDLPALILDEFKPASTQLLDLPNDLLPLILGHSGPPAAHVVPFLITKALAALLSS